MDILSTYPEIEQHVIAYTDNHIEENEKIWRGQLLYKPEELSQLEYDYIVISSVKFQREISEQCIHELKISKEKLIFIDKLILLGVIKGQLLPKRVGIDASSLCQLNCVSCYMRQNPRVIVGHGYLRFKDFRKFLLDNPYVKEIELSNNGEVFLNPELEQILELAHCHNVAITINSGTNFNTVSDSQLKTLVTSQVRSITCSIDGTSQEVYSAYRRNGNYHQVIKNIETLNEYKKKYCSEYPKLKWQFIIMPHNEHQVLEAKQMAGKLGMEIFYKLTWDEGYVPQNIEFLREVTGLDMFSREEVKKETGNLYLENCSDLFVAPKINWDGRLLGCCRAVTGAFDVNVFEMGLENALKSEEYRKTQQMLLGEKVRVNENNPCLNCEYYKNMLGNHKFLYDDVL